MKNTKDSNKKIVSINYNWWIDDRNNWINLTWSSTLMTVDLGWSKVKILVDLWIFQWWEKSDLKNKEIEENLSDLDYVIITHAHMDHIGRLPMLIKKWFKWKILMTKITKQVWYHMLTDYVKLTKQSIEDIETWNKHKGQVFRNYLKSINYYDSLNNNTLKKAEKDKLVKDLTALRWTKANIKAYVDNAKAILAKNEIYKESDIQKSLLNNNIELLYDSEDINKVMWMVEVLEVWENLDLDNRIVLSDINDEFIDKIPELLLDWYNKKIYVLPHLKNQIIKKWKENFNTDLIISKIQDNKKQELDKEMEKLENSFSLVNSVNLEEISNKFIKEYKDSKISLIRNKLFYIDDLEFKSLNIFKWEKSEEILEWLNSDKIYFLDEKSKSKIITYIKSKWIENVSYYENLLIVTNKDFNLENVVLKDTNLNKKLENFSENNLLLIDSNKEHEFDDYLNKYILNLAVNLSNFEDINLVSKDFLNDYKLLEAKNITKKEDLEKYKSEKLKEINSLKDNFSKADFINRVSLLLEPSFWKDNKKIVETFKLKFFDAGHIEWSIQAVVTLVTKQIDHTLNKTHKFNPDYKKEHHNYLFTWDLGKITEPNKSWTPDIPWYKFDYVQIETTYADRDHPNKDEEFNKLIHEINSTHWKTIIAAFSLQRIQEIIIDLIQNKVDNKELKPKFDALKLRIKPLKKRFIQLSKIENLTEEEEWEKNSYIDLMLNIECQIKEIQEKLFTWKILLDSPLSTRISKIFETELWEKYSLLWSTLQKRLLWEEVITILDRWEYKKVYEGDRIKKKELIVSSGWMLQWWAIINHIKQILDDPNSKIIFVWYQAEWTLWNEILSWKKQVIIEWEVYNVKCKIVQIKWYSSHIWKSDLIDYTANKLKYSKNAKLVLVHWDENRLKLKENILLEMKKTWKKVDIIIPSLWEKLDMTII